MSFPLLCFGLPPSPYALHASSRHVCKLSNNSLTKCRFLSFSGQRSILLPATSLHPLPFSFFIANFASFSIFFSAFSRRYTTTLLFRRQSCPISHTLANFPFFFSRLRLFFLFFLCLYASIQLVDLRPARTRHRAAISARVCH